MSTPEPPRRPRPPVPPPTEPLNPSRRLQAPGEPLREYERLPPDASASGPWSEGPWPAVLAAVVALLVGGLFGYLAGNNSGSGNTAAQTVTNTTTVTQPKTVTNTVTSSTIKETPSPANQANEERLREAESNLRKVEKENQELRRQVEQEGGAS
jgi:negative regulator of sigma E activity